MYDEFGNLKKKFRSKTQPAETGRALPGAGRAGWEVEEIGTDAFCGMIILTWVYVDIDLMLQILNP